MLCEYVIFFKFHLVMKVFALPWSVELKGKMIILCGFITTVQAETFHIKVVMWFIVNRRHIDYSHFKANTDFDVMHKRWQKGEKRWK